MLRKLFGLLVIFAAFSLACFMMFLIYSKECTQRVVVIHRKDATAAGPRDPCPDVPPNLVGPLHVEFQSNRSLQEARRSADPRLRMGGRHQPAGCVAKQKVAIIIPFRNRHEHLTHWLHYLHPILIRQQLDYGVYVINQDGDGVFNKASLMNIGFVEALTEYDYQCFVFSDVDLIPLDDRNLYRCSDNPRHLSVAIDKFNFVLPYDTIYGGVTALSKEQFLKVNGFSNTFWGWGGEDDDMFQRITFRGMSISRPDSVTGRYKMIRHRRDLHNEANPIRMDKLTETNHTIDQDGLNSLNYTIMEIRKESLFTFITAEVPMSNDTMKLV